MEVTKATGRSGISRTASIQDEHKIIQAKLRSAIRQVWSRYSPERKEVLHAAKRTKRKTNKDGSISKKPDVYYVCAACKREHKQDNVAVDHKSPVGKTPSFPPVVGEPSWVDWLGKLFCKKDNLQVLCKACHNLKTAMERANGKIHRPQKAKRDPKKIKRRGKSKTRNKNKKSS